MNRALLVPALAICACTSASSPPSTTTSGKASESTSSAAMPDLARCQVSPEKLLDLKSRGYDSDTFGWKVTCDKGSLEVMEMPAAKGLAAVQKRAESQALGVGLGAGTPTSRPLEPRVQARVTPLKDMFGTGEQLSVVSASFKLDRHAVRGAACKVRNSDIPWCLGAIRAIKNHKVVGLPKSWVSFGRKVLSVPMGCAVPAPGTIGCQASGIVWRTDPYQVKRLLTDRSMDAAIEKNGGSVTSKKAPCSVSGQPAQCEVRTYNLPTRKGKPQTRVAIFAKAVIEGVEVGIGCDAGPTAELPPVCQRVLRMR